MRASTLIATLLASAATTVLSFDVAPPPGVPRSLEEFRRDSPSYTPRRSARDCRKTFTIRSSANATDDISAEFLEGIHKANGGGTLYLPKDELFVISKPLDLTFLDDIHVRLDGKILFPDDVPTWQATAFKHPFQTNLLFWKWGGKDIRIYGEGVIDGQGQRWWTEFGKLGIPADNNYTYARPVLFYVGDATNVRVEGIHFKDSPIWHQLIERTQGISYRDVSCTAHSTDESVHPANTDFFNSLNVRDVKVERVWVDIGDDCLSPKSNSSGIHVDGMYCQGSHGQSMGSLGEHKGVQSILEDVLIENVWMLNGGNGARIKVWAGPTAGFGHLRNVTFRNVWNANNEWLAQLDSCYWNMSPEVCNQYPAGMSISDVTFENFTGYSSGRRGRAVAKITCSTSPDAVCENIRFVNWNVESPCGGPPVIICDGVTGDTGDVPCYPSNSPEAKAALADTCTGVPSNYTGKPWDESGSPWEDS